jgi:hypothetical protein
MKYAAININFDSLGEAYGFPDDFKDPSFGIVADRFMTIARNKGFKYSIYVLGRDLEKAENKKAVSKWHREGHEIGNHSWSHPMNLGALSKDEILNEIKWTHKAITETIGEEPKGFIAPTWSTSKNVFKTLIDLGYEYDTSVFPSLLMYPGILKMLANHVGDARFFKIFRRHDLHYPFFASRHVSIFRSSLKELIMMPLPTTKLRMACWHTTAFTFGWSFHLKLLRSCLKELDAFYYLIHPADLIGPQDLDCSRTHHLERMGIGLEKKIELLERAIDEIILSGRKLVTMRELSKHVTAARERLPVPRPLSDSAEPFGTV